MRILSVLTYYRPHTSGLTIYAERLARALVRQGHSVTVLTSRFDPALPADEIKDGVRIYRAPVVFRVSKGVIMPTFGLLATRLVLKHDVVHLHLPQFDAAGVALRGRVFGRPTVITYHCDLELPHSALNAVVNPVVHLMNHLAAVFADRIVAYTDDFAQSSPYLKRYSEKLSVILPPVEMPRATPSEIDEFRRLHNPAGRHPVIGMAARLAAEKGVEVLLDALPRVLERFPDARVLFAGQYREVLGEEAYFQRLWPRIEEHIEAGRWKFLGVLNPAEMAAFYPNLNVLLVPSLNSTETFGLVQIEAMMNGVPCVASDLPGVRQPVRMTGMGEIFPIGDAASLAAAMCKIFEQPEAYQGDPQAIAERFASDRAAADFQELFKNLLNRP